MKKNGREIFLTPQLSDISDQPDCSHGKYFPDEEFTKWQPQAMALLFVSSQRPIRKSSIKNSNKAVISVLARVMRLRPLSGLSSHHRFPWFPNPGNPGNFVQYIIF